MNNNLDYIFGMYVPEKDSVLVNLANDVTIELSCQKCHSNLILEESANIWSSVKYWYKLKVNFLN